MHEVRIEHDERFMARPFGIYCTCHQMEPLGAAETMEEAERIAEGHKAFWEFLDSLFWVSGRKGAE